MAAWLEQLQPPPPPPVLQACSEPISEPWRRCDPCSQSFSSEQDFQSHCHSLGHTLRTSDQPKPEAPSTSGTLSVQSEKSSQSSTSSQEDFGKSYLASLRGRYGPEAGEYEEGELVEEEPAPKRRREQDPPTKEPFSEHPVRSSEFHCSECNISCTSKDHLQLHYAGKKHKKFLSTSAGRPSNPQEPVVKMQDKLDSCRDPLIGLSYAIEYLRGTEPVKYECKLCCSQYPESLALLAHLRGVRHRLNYIKQHRSDLNAKIQSAPTEKARQDLAEQFARQIEMLEGRSAVTQRVLEAEKPPTANAFKLTAEVLRPLLHALASSSVENEEDAALCTKVQNALTQALMSYRSRQSASSIDFDSLNTPATVSTTPLSLGAEGVSTESISPYAFSSKPPPVNGWNPSNGYEYPYEEEPSRRMPEYDEYPSTFPAPFVAPRVQRPPPGGDWLEEVQKPPRGRGWRGYSGRPYRAGFRGGGRPMGHYR